MRCSYTVWNERPCPHDAVEDKELCIFHLPVAEKTPSEFWRHFIHYYSALLKKAEDDQPGEYTPRGTLRSFETTDPNLVARYEGQIRTDLPWQFIGFKFPASDPSDNLAFLIFAASDFREAEFAGDADFSWITGTLTVLGTATLFRNTVKGQARFLHCGRNDVNLSLFRSASPASRLERCRAT